MRVVTDQRDVVSAQMILNVEDYAPGRYARTKVLVQAGFDVIEASTGADALKRVMELKPHLVILGIQLPDISGLEVCQ
jgi:DNA-binding response OmpR family regulator